MLNEVNHQTTGVWRRRERSQPLAGSPSRSDRSVKPDLHLVSHLTGLQDASERRPTNTTLLTTPVTDAPHRLRFPQCTASQAVGRCRLSRPSVSSDRDLTGGTSVVLHAASPPLQVV